MNSFVAILQGSVAFVLITISTLIHGLILMVLALFKLLAPEGSIRRAVRAALTFVAESWIGFNNLLLSAYRGTQWQIDLPVGMNRKGCYLVLSNHQSWVDILVLQRCFNRRLPLLRFFLKQSLIWVPVLGPCWWALDFPFMKRASREELQRRPELRGADLESARRACEKFREVPVSMMSFPEGTRFTTAKKQSTGSPYEHLLKPKAGGLGQVIYALGEQLDGCVDVTIAYPDYVTREAAPTFWDLLCGRVLHVNVSAQIRDIPESLQGRNFKTDLSARENLQTWVSDLWHEKDATLNTLLDR